MDSVSKLTNAPARPSGPRITGGHSVRPAGGAGGPARSRACVRPSQPVSARPATAAASARPTSPRATPAIGEAAPTATSPAAQASPMASGRTVADLQSARSADATSSQSATAEQTARPARRTRISRRRTARHRPDHMKRGRRGWPRPTRAGREKEGPGVHAVPYSTPGPKTHSGKPALSMRPPSGDDPSRLGERGRRDARDHQPGSGNDREASASRSGETWRPRGWRAIHINFALCGPVRVLFAS